MAKWLLRRWFLKIFLYSFLCKENVKGLRTGGLTDKRQTKKPRKVHSSFLLRWDLENLTKKKHTIANQKNTVLNIRYFSIVGLFDGWWIQSALPTVIFVLQNDVIPFGPEINRVVWLSADWTLWILNTCRLNTRLRIIVHLI